MSTKLDKPAPGSRNFVRIIGGGWRGRRVQFSGFPGLRPTPDRVRETLFNWLQNSIVDTRCLDLFAGSGALGLEALSRGARQVVFVEQAQAAARALQGELQRLGGTARARVMELGAARFLRGAPETAGGPSTWSFSIRPSDETRWRNMFPCSMAASGCGRAAWYTSKTNERPGCPICRRIGNCSNRSLPARWVIIWRASALGLQGNE